MRFWTSKGSTQEIAGKHSILFDIMLILLMDVWYVTNMRPAGQLAHFQLSPDRSSRFSPIPVE